ncbi:hypothetical protein [Micromonospora sp. HUAS LYJ1]|uniref:hypothetical protein n=1 Tax=Micromonospora sp. HUAS LYJ1 TaxID=3061626 RepID=UPI002673044E|nr:hypothetical protein [Micromonospora sp. HUAS LYJ1]WKU05477.1 hypothetical protein Q2K16_32880 [Micromonospora sp. HUAS LYJ1]
MLRIGFGARPDVGGATTDGRVEVVIRGNDAYKLAGELAGLVEYLEVTGRRRCGHLASIGNTLVERYGPERRGTLTAER